MEDYYQDFNQIIFEVGKMYRFIDAMYMSLVVFKTKEAAGSYPQTSYDEEVGNLQRHEPFLVVAVEPYNLSDHEDVDNDFIKIITSNTTGWIYVDAFHRTPHFEEFTEEVAQREENHRQQIIEKIKCIMTKLTKV